jgi:hypothetical protein
VTIRLQRVAMGSTYPKEMPLNDLCWAKDVITFVSKPNGQVGRQHGMEYHYYADDTHVYLVIEP